MVSQQRLKNGDARAGVRAERLTAGCTVVLLRFLVCQRSLGGQRLAPQRAPLLPGLRSAGPAPGASGPVLQAQPCQAAAELLSGAGALPPQPARAGCLTQSLWNGERLEGRASAGAQEGVSRTQPFGLARQGAAPSAAVGTGWVRRCAAGTVGWCHLRPLPAQV